jgi:integrase
MKLTDTAIRNAKPKDKPYKMADGWGMYLYIHTNGSKYWRFKYRFLKKEKVLALGVYPDVSLKDARERRDEARKKLAGGVDPGESKKEEKIHALLNAENSFEAIALEWLEKQKASWTPRYAFYVLKRLESDIFPKIGRKPITAVTAPELLAALRVIEERGALELAQRALQTCGQVFMYAIASCRAERNPAADLKGALTTPVKTNYAHLKEVDLPEFLQRLELYDGNLQTKLAIKFLILTMSRTIEVRGALWSEINWEKKEWHIPAQRMKMRRPHVVPLSHQALEVLEQLKPLSGHWQFLFPNQFKPVKPMSENAILYAIYRMGYHGRTTGHGFRHTLSTLLNEQGFRSDIIEVSLAHTDKDKIRGTYNHATYLEERRKMLQWLGDYLDRAANGGGNVFEKKFKIINNN